MKYNYCYLFNVLNIILMLHYITKYYFYILQNLYMLPNYFKIMQLLL